MRRRSCLLAITVGMTLPAVAQAQGADSASAQSAMITVTDLAGRQVKVRAPVRRILLGEGRLLHLVAALDHKALLDRIAAWRNDMIQDDPASYRQYLAAFPKLAQIPRFGGNEGSIIDIERAIVQNLDAVILNIETKRSMEDAGYIEKLAALDIPTIYVDFRHDPTVNTEPTIRLLGTLLGRQDRAEKIIAFRNEQMRRVSAVIATLAPQRPRVFIERIGGFSDDCCLSFGDGNFGRFVEMAGGSNIAKGLIPATFGQLNPEQVIAANPDCVVITSADWQANVPGGHWIALGPDSNATEAQRKLAWFPSRPAYTDIKAQKRQAFYGIWHQFYNSPYDFVAIQRLAKWFHPALFADLDPDATFSAFHDQFLPVDYRPGYWVSLGEP